MNIIKQKNIYYVDLNQNTYRGYIETYINTTDELLIRYKFAALEITAVSVFQNGELVSDAIFTIEYLRDKTEDQKVFQNTFSNFLNVRLSEAQKNSEIKIKIDYKSIEENSSVVFYKPLDKEDKHKEVIGINKNNDSSGLFPSVDSNQTYRWELIYIYSSLEELKVISPGILKNFVEEEDLCISSYAVGSSCPGMLNFAVGTYERHEIYNGDDRKIIFCPLNMEHIKESVGEIIEDFSNIIKYAEYFIQMSYPLESLNVLFTLMEIDKVNSLNTAIYNISHISTFNDIEPKFLIKRIISEIIATQIFNFHVSSRDLTDYWIFCGLKGYLEDYCVRILLGNNEFLFQYKNDKDFVIKNDIYELPLCDEKRERTSYDSDFYIKKCKLVFHTLENNLSKAFLEKISHFLMKKRNEIKENFTSDFLSLIKDITGKDMKQFFEFYVFKPGLVRVNFKFNIDTKKNKVDYKITQEPTSQIVNRNLSVIGNITLMSYEVEGCFEHIINVAQNNHFYYHIRTKKRKKVDEEEDEVMPLLWMRLDPKREQLLDGIIEQPDYMFIEQALDKNVIGQLEALEQLEKSPSIQICEVLERILDNSHVFYKVRINVMYILSRTNIETFVGFQRLIQFFTKKYFVQSSTIVKPNEFMFVNYFLQKHCVRALSLTDPFVVKTYNGRSVSSATVICSFLINILKFNDNSANSYNDSWYIASVIENLSRPILALQFSDLSDDQEFKISTKNSAVEQINEVEVKDTYENLKREDYDIDENSSDDLKEIFDEDNTESVYFAQEKKEDEDEKSRFIKEALEEVERYRIMDMIFPSHKNIITEATIYLLGRLSIYGCIGLKKETLIDFSKYPNSLKVRKAAFIMLVLLFNDDYVVLTYLLDVVKKDFMTIKLIILDAWINLLGIRNQEAKKELRFFEPEIRNLIACEYDFDFKNKVNEIISFLEDKDLSTTDYNLKMVELSKNSFNTNFFMNKVGSDISVDSTKLLRIKLKNFKEMKKQLLAGTYIIKLSKPSEKSKDLRIVEETVEKVVDVVNVEIKKDVLKADEENKETKVKNTSNEIKFESKNQKDASQADDENYLTTEQKNTKLEDTNLEEMLKFEELENHLSATYDILKDTKNPQSVVNSSNDLSSINLSRNTEHFNRLVNFENDQFNDKSIKNTNQTINKLFEEFRSQVSENSRKSDSGSFSGVYNYLEPNFDETYDDLSRTENKTDEIEITDYPRRTDNISMTESRLDSEKKIDLEKFLLDDDSDEIQSTSCKTQVLEERDFDKQFGRIDFETSTRNNYDSAFRNFSDNSSSVVEKGNFSSYMKSGSSFKNESSFIPTSSYETPMPKANFPMSSSRSPYVSTESQNAFEPDTNYGDDNFFVSNELPEKNPIENFLDSDEDEFIPKRKLLNDGSSIPAAYRVDELTIRFPYKPKIRIPVASSSFSSSDSEIKKRGRKKKQDDDSSPEFYSTKKTSYNLKNNDPITKKLFYGTINNVSIKQVNKVIYKNKDKGDHFFDWRPKLFKEIEVNVNNESKYKKIWKEMERSLVFALSYSQFGSRTFNITKRLFDTFEIKVYETYQIPQFVHPLSTDLRNYCVDFLNKLYLNEKFQSFIRPVNIGELSSYVDIVRSPMCLDIVQKKMMKYSTLEAFYGDIKQIIKNCCYFNNRNSEICQSAKKLLKKTQDFDKCLINYKKEIKSEEFIKLLLQRFEDSANFMEIMRKFENRQILTFNDLINEVRKIQSTSMRKFISQQELHHEIEIFEDQIFHAFSVLNQKVYSWDIN